MRSIEEIKSLKKHYTEELYKQVRKEQGTDQQFRDDTFDVPEIKEPLVIKRSGIGARMVDSPAEQIITSNPQAFIDIFKGDKTAWERISEEINQRWIDILRRQMPNPFKEFVKNLLLRGEAFISPRHNQRWVTNAIGGKKDGTPIFDRRGLPVLFLIPDPMVIYASPEEDENGIPEIVIVKYPRQPNDVIVKYSNWSNPRRADPDDIDSRVEWSEFWCKSTMQFEADGEIVVRKDNPYGFPPFIRKYSGFGRRSPEGKLEDLIVSDIRMSRDLIREECAVRSLIDSIIHLFSQPRIDLILPIGSKVNVDELREKYDMGPGSFNVLEAESPDALKPGVTQLPSAEVFQHHRNIVAEISQRSPFIMAGFPFGTSGRQQDITAMAAMRRYDTVVENTENAWATAFEMALKICDIIPTLKPDGLRKLDLKTTYKCAIKLKAEDPVEQDRLATLGDRLWAQGQGAIDLRTNLTQYQGKTQDEAEDIIANILVDRLTLYNPDVAEVMGMVFAEESGMERWIEQARQKRAMMEQQQRDLQKTAPKTTEERIKGEGEGLEVEGSRGARTSPERYTRGQ